MLTAARNLDGNITVDCYIVMGNNGTDLVAEVFAQSDACLDCRRAGVAGGVGQENQLAAAFMGGLVPKRSGLGLQRRTRYRCRPRRHRQSEGGTMPYGMTAMEWAWRYQNSGIETGLCKPPNARGASRAGAGLHNQDGQPHLRRSRWAD